MERVNAGIGEIKSAAVRKPANSIRIPIKVLFHFLKLLPPSPYLFGPPRPEALALSHLAGLYQALVRVRSYMKARHTKNRRQKKIA